MKKNLPYILGIAAIIAVIYFLLKKQNSGISGISNPILDSRIYFTSKLPVAGVAVGAPLPASLSSAIVTTIAPMPSTSSTGKAPTAGAISSAPLSSDRFTPVSSLSL